MMFFLVTAERSRLPRAVLDNPTLSRRAERPLRSVGLEQNSVSKIRHHQGSPKEKNSGALKPNIGIDLETVCEVTGLTEEQSQNIPSS